MSALKQIASRLFGGGSVFARKTPGGIRPEAFKQRSLRSRIMPTPIPPLLKISVGSADSTAIVIEVEIGERVRKYQRLASVLSLPDGRSQLPVHAPTSGVVSGIARAQVADHRNPEQVCIHLASDGEDEAIEPDEIVQVSRLSSTQIAAKIGEAGIVGMGGAGFPTAEKLATGQRFDIDLLIINAAECEPYICADEALIRERADQTLIGAEILRRASSAPRCIIAIEDSKPDAIEALRKALRTSESLEGDFAIVLVPSKYPAGSEKQLIQCVTGIEIPAGQLPAESGILVQNTGTAYAAYGAIVEGRPCIDRITTLCGESLQTPKNFEVLIGTPVSFLFDLCGIDAVTSHRSIVGGSLMGRELQDDEAVVCKTTNCLIAAGPSDFPAAMDEQACIRCGFCADACPAKLLPQQLLAFTKTGDTGALLDHGLFDCIECGACDYVCPSHIPLVSIYIENKNAIVARDEDIERSAYWQQRFQQHQARIKKDKDQSLARKAPTSKQEVEVEQKETVAAKPAAQEFLSKEDASREIAAAVARVKARRNESTGTKKGDSPQDEPGK